MNKGRALKRMVELSIILKVEDGWPPIAVECLPCTLVEEGARVEAAPLFVKDLSVGDVISVEQDFEGKVVAWEHVSKSNRTTIWLLRTAKSESDIDGILRALRSIKCNTVQLNEYGCYSIDVPESCPIEEVDALLAKLNQACVGIAYPSFRHV